MFNIPGLVKDRANIPSQVPWLKCINTAQAKDQNARRWEVIARWVQKCLGDENVLEIVVMVTQHCEGSEGH